MSTNSFQTFISFFCELELYTDIPYKIADVPIMYKKEGNSYSMHFHIYHMNDVKMQQSLCRAIWIENSEPEIFCLVINDPFVDKETLYYLSFYKMPRVVKNYLWKYVGRFKESDFLS